MPSNNQNPNVDCDRNDDTQILTALTLQLNQAREHSKRLKDDMAKLYLNVSTALGLQHTRISRTRKISISTFFFLEKFICFK